MPNQLKKIAVFLLVSVVAVSCGTQRKSLKLEDVELQKVISAHKDAGAHFRTLRGRIRATYTSKNESQAITVSFRMKKDEAIWLSAKLAGIFPLAKILITPKGVKYYEKINKTYFKGDFSLLNKWLGVSLDFKKIQNLLTGQSVYPLQTGKYTLKESQNSYEISSVPGQPTAKMVLLNPKTFKATAQQIVEKQKQQSVTITYPKYQEINTFSFPKEIKILAHQKKENVQVELEYRALDVDVPVSFPFEIPEGYQKITSQ